MPNITVTIDHELYRQVRICAAWHGTTVTAMVRRYLEYAIEKSPYRNCENGNNPTPSPSGTVSHSQ
jgi:plasmid stability protein